jgi:hypothetical protein
MNHSFTEQQILILQVMNNAKRFPIVRLELHSSKEEELVNTALNYVWITDEDDSMEEVKERGEAIKSLMEQGLVFIDYTIRVWVAGDYDIYYKSKIYELLCHTVMESAKQPNTLFDTPYLRKGYAQLTRKGEKIARQL